MTLPSDNEGQGVHLPPALTAIERRLIDQAADIMREAPQDILFQHSALCQTYFPYRDPGGDVREWLQTNGQVTMHMQAGIVLIPQGPNRPATTMTPGLPFGPKARLVLAHLNTRALKQGGPRITLEEESFTQFVRSMQDPLKKKAVAPNGREIRAYKDQIMRLNTVHLQLAMPADDGYVNKKPQIIEEFCFSVTRNAQQRLLWPEYLLFGERYWQTLEKHAIPLDERALAALAHSPMALDIYCWLAQRLHRIPQGKELFLSRSLLWRQFGHGFNRLNNFAAAFKDALRQAVSQYPSAVLSLTREGLTMQNSPPPIAGRLIALAGPTKSKKAD